MGNAVPMRSDSVSTTPRNDPWHRPLFCSWNSVTVKHHLCKNWRCYCIKITSIVL